MRKGLLCLIVLGLVGCSSNSTSSDGTQAEPEKKSESRVVTAAKTQSARLAAPSKPLASFSQFELKPFVLGAEVEQDKKKVKVAKQLEDKMSQKLQPLLDEWAAKAGSGASGTLTIQPVVHGLKVVSGGSRFWAGGWAGNSFVDMNLKMVDRAGTNIAEPRIERTADANAGSWTVGATDRNLLNYIVEISYQYLVRNYQPEQ